MNLAIALTAARYGAATANYAEVLRLLKTTDPASGKQRVCGVRCRDVLTGGGLCVRARLAGGLGTPWQPPARLRPPSGRLSAAPSSLGASDGFLQRAGAGHGGTGSTALQGSVLSSLKKHRNNDRREERGTLLFVNINEPAKEPSSQSAVAYH